MPTTCGIWYLLWAGFFGTNLSLRYEYKPDKAIVKYLISP